LWARRIGQNAWQFPQGGMRSDETPAEAMYRELSEEVGLQPEHVEVIGATRNVYRKALDELAPLLFPDGAPESVRK
jgi:putative (di)nucleoside polyphosphate hydrolase